MFFCMYLLLQGNVCIWKNIQNIFFMHLTHTNFATDVACNYIHNLDLCIEKSYILVMGVLCMRRMPVILTNIFNISEAPPSYESIFGQVQAARRESNSVVEFFKKFLIILIGTCKFLISDKHLFVFCASYQQ